MTPRAHPFPWPWASASGSGLEGVKNAMWYRGSLQSSDAAITALSRFHYEIDLATAAGNVVITLPSTGQSPRYVGVTNSSTVADGSKVIIVQTVDFIEKGRLSAAGESMWFGADSTTGDGSWKLLAQANPSEYQWTWANATARLATQASAAQVGRIGYQSDIQRAFALLDVGTLRFGDTADPTIGYMKHGFACGSGIAGPNVLGVQLSVNGTTTAIASTSTTRSLALPRFQQVSLALAGSVVTVRTVANNGFFPAQGFRYRAISFPGVTSASARWFNGLTNGVVNTNVDPATVNNLIAIGRGNAEANLQLYHRGAAGGTQVDLGASFPANTAGLGYEFEVYTPDGASYGWMVTALDSGLAISGILSITLPAATTRLAYEHYMTNNADASAISLDVGDTMHVPRAA